jgi:hypothetical protein
MLIANVIVSPNAGASGAESGAEDWGNYEFISSPNLGETIHLSRERIAQTLVVKTVRHLAVENPLPVSDNPLQRKVPSLQIVAELRW